VAAEDSCDIPLQIGRNLGGHTALVAGVALYFEPHASLLQSISRKDKGVEHSDFKLLLRGWIASDSHGKYVKTSQGN
jgi:hypothetical protein